jgi:holo-[acyl-carrier protein] synthase
MIHGIGIDIVKTARIRTAVERWGQRFLERVFTADEISYAYKKADPFLSLAVRFAAKEAFIKASRKGQTIPLTDIEIAHHDNGSPLIHLKGKTKKCMGESYASCTIHVSLSHEKEYGVVCVVIENRP